MMTSEKTTKTMTEMEIEANKDLKLEYDQIMVTILKDPLISYIISHEVSLHNILQ